MAASATSWPTPIVVARACIATSLSRGMHAFRAGVRFGLVLLRAPLRTDPVEAHTARIVSAGFAIASLAFVAQSAAHFAYVFLFDARVGQLNLDAESNAFSWASSVTTFVAALLAVAVAFLWHRMWLLLVAAVLALFSLDDAVQLHEELGEWANGKLGLPDELARVIWPALFFPLLAFVFVALWRLATHAAKPVPVTIRLALGLLVLAIVAEASAAAWYGTGGEAETFVGALEIAIEESAELAGWVLVATGLAATAFARIYVIGRASPRLHAD